MSTTQIILFGGHVAIISIRALPLIEGTKWFLSKNGYVVSSRGQLLHRIITGAASGQHVDHINFDRLDNRDENLRLVSQAENNRNVRKRSHSKQLYKGVRARKLGTFTARIRDRGREIYLGTFATAREAAAAYNNAAQERFGPYAHVNVLRDEDRSSQLRLSKDKRSDSKQPYKGMRAMKQGTFQARIRINGREVHLGTFATAEAAAAAYNCAAQHLFSAGATE